MNSSDISEFKSADLPLVAYLRCEGYTIQRINKISPFKAEFVFFNIPRALLKEYNDDLAVVNPTKFAAIMHQLVRSAKNKSFE